MNTTSADAAELRLLSGIIALVLDEQPGQSAAALEALRRRAASGRITGGALKNLFERLTAEAAASGPQVASRQELYRLQLDLDAAAVQAARLAAENAALQHRVARAEREVLRYESLEQQRRRAGSAIVLSKPPPPRPTRHNAGILAGLLLALLLADLARDEWRPPPRPARPAAEAAAHPGLPPVVPHHAPRPTRP